MPSLFPASSLLIPHKSIRFCSIVSKARGFGCRMGLWRKCFKLVSTLSTSSSLLHCFTLLGSTLSTSVLHIPSGAAWPLSKDRYLQGRQISLAIYTNTFSKIGQIHFTICTNLIYTFPLALLTLSKACYSRTPLVTRHCLAGQTHWFLTLSITIYMIVTITKINVSSKGWPYTKTHKYQFWKEETQLIWGKL